MSTSGDKQDRVEARAALKSLEGAVAALLESFGELSTRATTAEAGRVEAEDLLERVTARGGRGDKAVHARVRDLEDENADLRRRLTEGRATVERILAKIRFLEDQG